MRAVSPPFVDRADDSLFSILFCAHSEFVICIQRFFSHSVSLVMHTIQNALSRRGVNRRRNENHNRQLTCTRISLSGPSPSVDLASKSKKATRLKTCEVEKNNDNGQGMKKVSRVRLWIHWVMQMCKQLSQNISVISTLFQCRRFCSVANNRSIWATHLHNTNKLQSDFKLFLSRFAGRVWICAWIANRTIFYRFVAMRAILWFVDIRLCDFYVCIAFANSIVIFMFVHSPLAEWQQQNI